MHARNFQLMTAYEHVMKFNVNYIIIPKQQ